jgi:hypothetical protein
MRVPAICPVPVCRARKSRSRSASGIWIRVSTEDQAKGESPEHHEKRVRFYAESKGWMVKEVEDVILPCFAEQDLSELADYEAIVRMGRYPRAIVRRVSLSPPPDVLNGDRRVAELRTRAATIMGRERGAIEARTRHGWRRATTAS